MLYCYSFSHFFLFRHGIRKVHNTGGITIKWDTSAAKDANFLTEHSYLEGKKNTPKYRLLQAGKGNKK